MAVTVEFTVLGGEKFKATVSNGKWKCESEEVQNLVEGSTKSISSRIGHHEPDPDFIIAQWVVKELSFLDGHIIHADPAREANQGPQGM